MGREEHNGGFIALHRSILDWEWYSDVNTRCLFIHLLLTANYENRKIRGTTVKRGQVLTTIRKLAEDVSLTPQKVKTALNHLESTHEITHSANPQGTVITIKNYEKYQTATHLAANNTRKKINTPANQQHTRATDCGATDCRDDSLDGNTDSNKRLTNNQQTTSNKEINIPPNPQRGDAYSSDFLAFWAAYPRKVGKGAAWKAFRRLCPDSGLLAAMLEAVGRQRGTQAWKKDGGQFIPHPSTWLNQRRWEDEPDTTSEEDNDDDVL